MVDSLNPPYPFLRARGVSACSVSGHLTVSFILPDESVERWRLAPADARFLVDSIPDYLGRIIHADEASLGASV